MAGTKGYDQAKLGSALEVTLKERLMFFEIIDKRFDSPTIKHDLGEADQVLGSGNNS